MSDLSNLNNHYCCNPYNLDKHTKKVAVKNVSTRISQIFPDVAGERICNSCVFRIYGEYPSIDSTARLQVEDSHTTTSSNDARTNSNTDSDVQSDSSPLKRSKPALIEVSEEDLYVYEAGKEVLLQLKDKIKDPTLSLSDKITLLTLAPKSWSVRETSRFFEISRRQVENAKLLVTESGIFSKPKPKRGHPLKEDTAKEVTAFYTNDKNSKLLSGMCDTMSIKQSDGSRVHERKRLMHCNLKELHGLFLDEFSNHPIGFSTFASLRPKHCIFAGASGTHSICVCIYHENVDLMLDELNISRLTKDTALHLKSFKDCIDLLVCKKDSSDCYIGKCTSCKFENENTFNNLQQISLRKHLESLVDKEHINTITFHCWTATDRAKMEVRQLEVDEFIDELIEKLYKLKAHDFIADQQYTFLKSCKNYLKKDEVIVCMDFSENLQFLSQNAISGVHWNTEQCTIFTVVYYYKNGRNLEHGSMVILSDELTHSTAAVHTFQEIIIKRLKILKKNLEKVYYFTDGAVQHFKNRFSFHNLQMHFDDFGVRAEHHFFETAHGKGPGDGIGANFKTSVRRTSLQAKHPSQQILTIEKLYQWAKTNEKKIEVFICRKTEIAKSSRKLQARFKASEEIHGIRESHSWVTDEISGTFVHRRFSS